MRVAIKPIMLTILIMRVEIVVVHGVTMIRKGMVKMTRALIHRRYTRAHGENIYAQGQDRDPTVCKDRYREDDQAGMEAAEAEVEAAAKMEAVGGTIRRFPWMDEASMKTSLWFE